MATLESRLSKLEAERRAADKAEVQAIVDEHDAWLERFATDDERAAWMRWLLSIPLDDDRLAKIGMTRAEHDTILAERGPCTADDLKMLFDMAGRMPPVMCDRVREVIPYERIEAP